MARVKVIKTVSDGIINRVLSGEIVDTWKYRYMTREIYRVEIADDGKNVLISGIEIVRIERACLDRTAVYDADNYAVVWTSLQGVD